MVPTPETAPAEQASVGYADEAPDKHLPPLVAHAPHTGTPRGAGPPPVAFSARQFGKSQHHESVVERSKAGPPEETKVHADKQWQQAKGTQPNVECGCGRVMPLRFFFKCLFCRQYLCEPCAEVHFGKSRQAYYEEKANAEEG